MSCHSTADRGHDTTPKDDQCDCMYKDDFLVQEKSSAVPVVSPVFAGLDVDLISPSAIYEVIHTSTYDPAIGGPPQVSDSSPALYLQYSNFRI